MRDGQELEEQERLAATADVEEEMETGEVGALDTANKKGNKKQKKKKAPVRKFDKIILCNSMLYSIESGSAIQPRKLFYSIFESFLFWKSPV